MNVLGIGGTTRTQSSTRRALDEALDAAAAAGGAVDLVDEELLAALPHYDPERPLTQEAVRLVTALRGADALIVASPGYHGSISGMVKNALDYAEELREDRRPYLSGVAVGCIATAYGWQAAVTTMQTLRTITHALRAHPTPLGVALNTANGLDDKAHWQLRELGREVVDLAACLPNRRPEAAAALT